MTPNKPSAVPAVKAAIRGYRSSEASAKDLISTVWAVLDQKLEGTASIINAFVDLLEEEDKKQDLLASWRAFDIEVRLPVFHVITFTDLLGTATSSVSGACSKGIHQLRRRLRWYRFWKVAQHQTHIKREVQQPVFPTRMGPRRPSRRATASEW